MLRSFIAALLLCVTGCVSGGSERASEVASESSSLERAQDTSSPDDESRGRAPWLESVDTVSSRYPAFGITLHFMAHVYEEPRKTARVVGYLRRGARFRASEEVSRNGCRKGWFEIFGGGNVCADEAFLIDSHPPRYESVPNPPAIWEPMPYPYAKVVAHDVPQYYRLPSPEEEALVLGLLATSDATTPDTQEADAGPTIADQLRSMLRVRMQPGFYVSIDGEARDEEHQRAFTRTVRGSYLRSERLVPASAPQGIGVTLGQEYRLPLALVYRSGAPVMGLDPVSGELTKTGEDWPLHSAHSLSGESLVRGGRRYYATVDGYFVRDTAVRVVAQANRPRPIALEERWIRVDLDRQTLTAYEGDSPVFATLVSSGLPDHATPSGVYRLHAKHVSTTMADNVGDEGAYSIEDVPWTMYFLGSFALHGAFWHNRFGHPRSHGCVNLAPRDARWLFFWTLPELPSAWHGVLADVGTGTAVSLDHGTPYSIEQGGS